MNLKGIFFDMDHTLCDTDGADRKALIDFSQLLQENFSEHDAHRIASQFLELIYGRVQLNDPSITKLKESPDLRALKLQSLIHQLEHSTISIEQCRKWERKFFEIRLSYFDLFPGAETLLKRLKSHFSLALITNGPEHTQIPKIKKTQLDQLMDFVVISSIFGVSKPDPRIFQHTLDQFKLKRSEVVYIGDKLNIDVLGAQNVGMKSIWLSEEENTSDIQPDYQVQHITELESLIQKL